MILRFWQNMEHSFCKTQRGLARGGRFSSSNVESFILRIFDRLVRYSRNEKKRRKLLRYSRMRN